MAFYSWPTDLASIPATGGSLLVVMNKTIWVDPTIVVVDPSDDIGLPVV